MLCSSNNGVDEPLCSGRKEEDKSLHGNNMDIELVSEAVSEASGDGVMPG